MDIVVVKDLDFLPRRFKQAREKKRRRLLLIAAIIIIATIANLAVWIPFKLEKDYLAKSRALDEKLSALNQVTPIYNQMVAKQKEYNQKKQVLYGLEESNFKVIPFLERISEAIPPGVYLSQLSIKADEGASITFISPSPVETAAMVVGLNNLNVFEAVDIETVPFMSEPKPVQLNLCFNWAKEKPKEDSQGEPEKEPDWGGESNSAIKETERKIKPQ